MEIFYLHAFTLIIRKLFYRMLRLIKVYTNNQITVMHTLKYMREESFSLKNSMVCLFLQYFMFRKHCTLVHEHYVMFPEQ